MRSRQLTRNRVNMHDIIAQPFGALPGAVDAILRRPEELDKIEVQSIFAEASFLILRAEEALASRDADAFCALFKLFSEGFARSEESFANGIETFGASGTLLQSIRGIFRGAVVQRTFPAHSPAVVELVQVISSLCDGDSIKEMCGALFMEDLANMLDDMYREPEGACGSFLAQRAVATALINLVKGSRQNKQRITSWKFLADCCALSVDVFFQLQCVELLFRVSRQNKSLLDHLGSKMSVHVVDKIRLLPNDATLLQRMIELLADINAHRTDILSFPVERVDAARATIAERTMAHFTAHYLVILVTSANADNVTIPYTGIRSVTLSKDGRAVFRLDDFPSKLEVLLSHAPSEDGVTLLLRPEPLAALKQSPIRGWIVAALGAKKSAPRQARGEKRASAADATAKRRRSESPPLAEADTPAAARVVAALQTIMKAADDGVDDLLGKMRQLVQSKMAARRGEVVGVLGEAMEGIQRVVDGGRAEAETQRDAMRQSVESGAQSVEERLAAAQGRVTGVVERLNAALQALKESHTAIHEQVACIEIEMQQSLEVSREAEARDGRAMRTDGEEFAGRLEAMLDRQLVERSDPMQAMADYLHGGRGVC